MKKMVRGLVLVVCLALFAGMAMGSESTTDTTGTGANTHATDNTKRPKVSESTENSSEIVDTEEDNENYVEETEPLETSPMYDYVDYTFGELIDDIDSNPLAASTAHADEYVQFECCYISYSDSWGYYLDICNPDPDGDPEVARFLCTFEDETLASVLDGLQEYQKIIVRGQITSADQFSYALDVYEIEPLEEILPNPFEILEEDIEYHSYTCSQLIDEYEQSYTAAERAHTDEYIEVTGYIAYIDSDGQSIAIGNGDPTSFNTIYCRITDEVQLAQIMNMKIGDEITIRGHMVDVGMFLGYQMEIRVIVE